MAGKAEKSSRTKRTRINFSPRQLEAMETVFRQTQYPDVNVLETLAQRMELPVEKICTWFQNRRSKFRRESKKGHITWMREQLLGRGSAATTSYSAPPQPQQTTHAAGHAQASTSASQVHSVASQPQYPAYPYPSYSAMYPSTTSHSLPAHYSYPRAWPYPTPMYCKAPASSTAASTPQYMPDWNIPINPSLCLSDLTNFDAGSLNLCTSMPSNNCSPPANQWSPSNSPPATSNYTSPPATSHYTSPVSQFTSPASQFTEGHCTSPANQFTSSSYAYTSGDKQQFTSPASQFTSPASQFTSPASQFTSPENSYTPASQYSSPANQSSNGYDSGYPSPCNYQPAIPQNASPSSQAAITTNKPANHNSSSASTPDKPQDISSSPDSAHASSPASPGFLGGEFRYTGIVLPAQSQYQGPYLGTTTGPSFCELSS